jgi:hypothetical protein
MMTTGTMMFVDGENFTLRGQATAAAAGVPLVPGRFYRANTFLWMPNIEPSALPLFTDTDSVLERPVRRAFYYTSARGTHDLIDAVREELWGLTFAPRVFKREGTRPSKRVDISLATEALTNAHLDNFETVVLVAGDDDYVPLVDEIKRTGKIVVVMFFEGPHSGMSHELRLAADRFCPLTELFLGWWRNAGEPGRSVVADGR